MIDDPSSSSLSRTCSRPVAHSDLASTVRQPQDHLRRRVTGCPPVWSRGPPSPRLRPRNDARPRPRHRRCQSAPSRARGAGGRSLVVLRAAEGQLPGCGLFLPGWRGKRCPWPDVGVAVVVVAVGEDVIGDVREHAGGLRTTRVQRPGGPRRGCTRSLVPAARNGRRPGPARCPVLSHGKRRPLTLCPSPQTHDPLAGFRRVSTIRGGTRSKWCGTCGGHVSVPRAKGGPRFR